MEQKEKQGEEEDSEMSDESCRQKSTILLTGLPGSGKSSIWNALLQSDISRSSQSGFHTGCFGGCLAPLHLVDADDEWDLLEENPNLREILDDTAALIFVIDGKKDLTDSLFRLYSTVKATYRFNSEIHLEIFLHKIDGIPEGVCFELVSKVQQRMMNEISECGLENAYFEVHMTSVFDVSLFEAFSKTVRKLISSIEMLDEMFHEFLMKSGLVSGFLLDTVNWICLTAGGHSIADLATYDLCCSLANTALRLSHVYGSELGSEADCRLKSSATLDMSRVVIVEQLDSQLAIVGILLDTGNSKRGLIDHNMSLFWTAFVALYPCYVQSRSLSLNFCQRENELVQGTS